MEFYDFDGESVLVTHSPAEQSRFGNRQWESRGPLNSGRHELFPVRSIRSVEYGYQEPTEAYEIPPYNPPYGRKRWMGVDNAAGQQALGEVRRLQLRHPQRRIHDVTRAPEVGRVMLPSEYDLGHVLALPADERRTLILDHDLRKAYGCLTFAVSHMHSLGICHKDIKPQNIVVRNSQLLLADFDVSSNLSGNSTSASIFGTPFTKKFKAPEFRMPGDRSDQSPADVFSLGLVLISVWSALEGWRPADPENFPSLAVSSPFHKNIPALNGWIQDRLEGRIQLTRHSARNKHQRNKDLAVLRILHRMVSPKPADRIRAAVVVAILRHLSTDSSFCRSCRISVEEEELEDVEMDWVFGGARSGADSHGEVKHRSKRHHPIKAPSPPRIRPSAGKANASPPPPAPFPYAEESMSSYTDEMDSTSDEDDEEATPFIGHAKLPGKTRPSAIETLLPRAANSASASPNSHGEKILFLDCFGRKFPCPYNSIRTWERMSKFIERKFPENMAETSKVGGQVQSGQYDLIGPRGVVIDPDFWEDLIQPDWTISMHLWPIAGESEPGTGSSDVPDAPKEQNEDKDVQAEEESESPPKDEDVVKPVEAEDAKDSSDPQPSDETPAEAEGSDEKPSVADDESSEKAVDAGEKSEEPEVSEEKAPDVPEEKSEEASEDKAAEATEEKSPDAEVVSEEKPAEVAEEEKPAEAAEEEKPAEAAEEEKPAEAAEEEKPAEAAEEEKPAEAAEEEKPAEAAEEEKPAEAAEEEKPAEAEAEAEKPTEASEEKDSESTEEKASESTEEKPTETGTETASEDKDEQKSDEKPSEEASEDNKAPSEAGSSKSKKSSTSSKGKSSPRRSSSTKKKPQPSGFLRWMAGSGGPIVTSPSKKKSKELSEAPGASPSSKKKKEKKKDSGASPRKKS